MKKATTAATAKSSALRRNARVREFKRELILEAARTVFDLYGLEGASLRAIAAEAGCTTGAIYGHFTGKEEIYAGLLRQSLLELEDEVRRADGSPRGRQARFMAFLRFYASRPSDFSLSLYLYDRKAPLGLGAELNRELNARLKAILTQIVHGDGPVKNGGNAEEALVFSMLAGLLISNRTGRLKLFGITLEPLAELAATRLRGTA